MFKQIRRAVRGFLFLDSIRANANEIESRRLEILGLQDDADEQIKAVQDKAARKVAKIKARTDAVVQSLELEMSHAIKQGEKLRGEELFASLPSRVRPGWTEFNK